MSLTTIRLLKRVEGFSNKFNDILFKRGIDSKPIVCYFGGDVQDLEEVMIKDNIKDNLKFIDYSLENTCNILSNKFEKSHIFVIRANRFTQNSFAIYDNFVVSDSFGCPKHKFEKQALIHLRLLLLNCFKQLNIELDFNKNEKIVLIGFSKGCVVLNQLLYAFYVTSDDLELRNLIQRIDCMYWCDGGHSGGSNTWITSQEVLKHFTSLKIKVHINVTPYQVMSSFKPWISKEENKFFELLTQFGANPQRVLHFKEEEISLEIHFKVLKHFV